MLCCRKMQFNYTHHWLTIIPSRRWIYYPRYAVSHILQFKNNVWLNDGGYCYAITMLEVRDFGVGAEGDVGSPKNEAGAIPS